MKFAIIYLNEFSEWYDELELVDQKRVDSRITSIKREGFFGDTRHLEGGLFELKFKNGLRIYAARTSQTEVTLFLGGTKHGQGKDIKKAKRLFNLRHAYS